MKFPENLWNNIETMKLVLEYWNDVEIIQHFGNIPLNMQVHPGNMRERLKYNMFMIVDPKRKYTQDMESYHIRITKEEAEYLLMVSGHNQKQVKDYALELLKNRYKELMVNKI